MSSSRGASACPRTRSPVTQTAGPP